MSKIQEIPVIQTPGTGLAPLIPGLLLVGTISAAAYGLRMASGFALASPLLVAMLIGIVIQNTAGTPAAARPGAAFACKRLLRLAIILLGLQLTIAQITAIGISGVVIIIASMASTFLFTLKAGQWLKVKPQLAELIAAGTSICGASAVIAANTVTRADEEDVAYAIACVTIFGSVAVVLYPLLPALLQLDAKAFGLWSGASIHEIAQVVATAFQDGQQAGEFGTVSKLTRILLLAPMILLMGAYARSKAKNMLAGPQAAIPLPWFVLGFVALVCVNSVVTIDGDIKAACQTVTTLFLAMALAAMGLRTDLGKLKARGIRPLLLGLFAFLFIATMSLSLIKLAG